MHTEHMYRLYVRSAMTRLRESESWARALWARGLSCRVLPMPLVAERCGLSLEGRGREGCAIRDTLRMLGAAVRCGSSVGGERLWGACRECGDQMDVAHLLLVLDDLTV